MAGINADLERVRAWIAAGIQESGLALKQPESLDDGGYKYQLRRPEVYLHAYPTNDIEKALPSALLELERVEWTADAVTYSLRLTLATWDSGTHPADRFASDGVGGWTPQTSGPYDRADGSKGAAIDLCTFADTLARHMQRNATAIGEGLTLSLTDGLELEVLEDDELERSGFRFGRFALTVRDPLPPAPTAAETPTAERAEDAAAPKIDIDSLL